jgi:hypothetical protein
MKAFCFAQFNIMVISEKIGVAPKAASGDDRGH